MSFIEIGRTEYLVNGFFFSCVTTSDFLAIQYDGLNENLSKGLCLVHYIQFTLILEEPGDEWAKTGEDRA